MINRFFVDQKELFSILSSMQPICSKRTTLDITSSILFQVGQRELILKSTDLEISLQANCTLINSTFSEPISFLVPGRRIFDLVKEFDGSIECVLRIIINCYLNLVQFIWDLILKKLNACSLLFLNVLKILCNLMHRFYLLFLIKFLF